MFICHLNSLHSYIRTCCKYIVLIHINSYQFISIRINTSYCSVSSYYNMRGIRGSFPPPYIYYCERRLCEYIHRAQQRTATHCRAHCHTLPHTATHCHTLPQTATYCCPRPPALPHAAARTATQCRPLPHSLTLPRALPYGTTKRTATNYLVHCAHTSVRNATLYRSHSRTLLHCRTLPHCRT
jgi:hypothetical protein